MVSVSIQTESTGPIFGCYKDSDSEILFKDADQDDSIVDEEYDEDFVVETKRSIKGMVDFNERALLNDEDICQYEPAKAVVTSLHVVWLSSKNRKIHRPWGLHIVTIQM